MADFNLLAGYLNKTKFAEAAELDFTFHSTRDG